ncbi:MAG: MunI family type II restriction endonuclease [Candidatus Poribacteria bacterium]|nr:MunI family type II restriction endonuclease [Candidatus Poribacteria bacterium]
MVAREHLEERDKWQDESATRGQKAEDAFFDAMQDHLRSESNLVIEKSPRDLEGIYGKHLSSGRPHGVRPDAVIRHTPSGRAIFIEIKRQRAAGNAHERACKYFTPGILYSGRQIAKQPLGVIPFWWVFTNGIASHPRYVQEITHWFRGIEGHMLLWEPRDPAVIVAHFDAHIRPLLLPSMNQ